MIMYTLIVHNQYGRIVVILPERGTLTQRDINSLVDQYEIDEFLNYNPVEYDGIKCGQALLLCNGSICDMKPVEKIKTWTFA